MKSLKATLTESIIHENLNESADNYAKYSDDLVKAAIAYYAGCQLQDVKNLSNEAKGYSYQLGHSSTFKTVSYVEVNQIIDLHQNILKKTFNIQ
jgi:hypothetical protein